MVLGTLTYSGGEPLSLASLKDARLAKGQTAIDFPCSSLRLKHTVVLVFFFASASWAKEWLLWVGGLFLLLLLLLKGA